MPAEPEPAWGPAVWRQLTVFAVIVALLAGIGIWVTHELQPTRVAALSSCHLGRPLGPRTFASAPPMCIDPSRTYVAHISTASGTITIKLDAGQDPVTVNNFVALASSGFYNGLSFSKVASWYVQGGDPGGDGRGGPGYHLPPEPAHGGWGTGSVGMARDPGGVNGSQFFILKSPWPNSGPPIGQYYNKFGSVTAGSATVDAITAGQRILNVSISVS